MNVSVQQRWWVCGLYAAGVTGVSLMPSRVLPEASEWLPHQDKLLHALMYAGLAVVLGWALQRRLADRPAAWLAFIVASAALYGALLEAAQGAILWVGRTCSSGDALANLAGAAAGAALIFFCSCRRERRSMRQSPSTR